MQVHACAGPRTQKRITLSTTKAEYVALADLIKGAMFVRYVWNFTFLGFGKTCITAFEDNEGARYLTQNPVCT